jgi:TfoX/Sxy family transcriptional regulator of competence genes
MATHINEESEVVDGLYKDDPVFRITYRNEIYIRAKNHHEAERIFSDMDPVELARKSSFVEITSTEKQD